VRVGLVAVGSASLRPRARGTDRDARYLLAIAAWAVAVLAGTIALWRYKTRPGDIGPFSATWPGASALHRESGRPTLVVFAHPYCPCSHATVTELAIALSRRSARTVTHVMFSVPSATPADAASWDETPLWRAASRLPGVHVAIDTAGREARAFGARTSGQTFVYDADGRLRFAGGVTAARGHEGGNLGLDRMTAALDGWRGAGILHAPVFGCPLEDPVEPTVARGGAR
jgi:hypothetical protein